MDVLEALLTRRAVRKFKKDPVPPEILEKILEAGRWSPSASNSQPWDFIVITEPELRRRLSRSFMYGLFLAEAPLGIAVVVDPWRSGCAVQDGAIAAYGIWLAAHGLGLGACWINPNMDEGAVRNLLDLPEGKELICILAIGYPAQSVKSVRRKLKDIVHIERYGNRGEGRAEE